MADVSGVRKSAILLLSLTQDQAAEILKRLPPEAVEEVSREIAQLGEIRHRHAARKSSASFTTWRWPIHR